MRAKIINIIVTLVILLISGCANEIKFATNKDKLYLNHLTNTILVTNTPDSALDIEGLIKLNSHYYARAIDYLKDELKKNGVSVQVVKVDPLAIDPDEAVKKAIMQTKATTVFSVNVVNREISNFHPLWGRMFSQTYEIQMSITDTASQKGVWRSSLKVAQDYNGITLDKNMQEIATQIVASLKNDNLL